MGISADNCNRGSSIREDSAGRSQVSTKKTAGLKKGGVLDGGVIFELYDAHGYLVDLTELMAQELSLTCDMAGCSSSLAPSSCSVDFYCNSDCTLPCAL
jgi:hypothetical protein